MSELCPPKILDVEILTLSISEVTEFGNRVFKEVIKLK